MIDFRMLWAALASALLAAPAAARATENCAVGAYRLSDGGIVDVAPADAGKLRWRRIDGRSGLLAPGAGGGWSSTLGWTGRADGIRVSFGPCGGGTIRFGNLAGRRLAFAVTETRFRNADAELAGRLVLPRGNGRVPIVVLVHGSEQSSARDAYALQRLFPAAGIGAFVYDKRGTGGSGGRYTQDYLLLAEDAIAAASEARRLAGDRAGPLGYQAGSQGGWVAPLAARIAPVDFVIIGFGLAVSPREEEREAIAYDMTSHGFGPDVVNEAMAFADAAEAIIESNFTQGYDRLEAARRLHANKPWFRYVRGDITHVFLGMSEAQLRRDGPALLPNVPLHYDPMPVLRTLDVPQLWILGAEDRDAPSAETARRLRGLAAQGRPISVAIFPHTEHGIYEYEEQPDGERLSTRQPEGYFRMMRDFILTRRLRGDYGAALSTAASSRH
jgi:pimeloyl-ACP methyl ester carboxylesterase